MISSYSKMVVGMIRLIMGVTNTNLRDEAKARFENPCGNTIFDHVEAEFIGNQSYIYNSLEHLEHPNDDSDQVIF